MPIRSVLIVVALVASILLAGCETTQDGPPPVEYAPTSVAHAP